MDEPSLTTFSPVPPPQSAKENPQIIGIKANEEVNSGVKKGRLKKKQLILLIASLGLIISVLLFILYKVRPQFLPKILGAGQFKLLTIFSSSARISPPQSSAGSSFEPSENIVTPTNMISPTATATPRPVIKITSTPTPIPRTPNPPVVEILSPREMQTIELTNSNKDLCISESIRGGETSGLQRKHNINDGGWSSYSNFGMFCFEPREGLNKLQFQYRNKYGDESGVGTRQFNFHRVQYFTVSLNGQLYRDVNCNGTRDSDEGVVTVSATINVIKMPEYSLYDTINSDGNGHFSYPYQLREDESVTFTFAPVSPPGYTSNPSFSNPIVTFNKDSLNFSLNIPQVPNENHSACY